MDLSPKSIESLIALAIQKNLSELTLEDKDQKITIKTALAPVQTAAAPSHQHAKSSPEPASSTERSPVEVTLPSSNSRLYQVTSPMVGTFYRAPSPNAPPFVEIGTTVRKGQTLCIIEAMKLMNELECEVDGIVRKLHVDNSKPVEFGQLLMEIEVEPT